MIILFKSGPNDTYPLQKINNNSLIIIPPNSDNIKDMAIIRGLTIVELKNKNKSIDLSIDLFIDFTIDDYETIKNIDSLKYPTIFPKLNLIKFKCKTCYKFQQKPFNINLKKLNNVPVTYCSDKCINKSKEIMSNKTFLYIPKNSEIFAELEKTARTYVVDNFASNTPEKFQDSMRKEAIRLDFARKREEYKKEMRQVSVKKSKSNSMKKYSENICKSKTKKGKRCTNRTVKGCDFCGITSHNVLYDKGKDNEKGKGKIKRDKIKKVAKTCELNDYIPPIIEYI